MFSKLAKKQLFFLNQFLVFMSGYKIWKFDLENFRIDSLLFAHVVAGRFYRSSLSSNSNLGFWNLNIAKTRSKNHFLYYLRVFFSSFSKWNKTYQLQIAVVFHFISCFKPTFCIKKIMQKNSFILRNLESITSKIASLVKLMHLKIADNPFTFAFALMRKGAKIGSSFHASYSSVYSNTYT